MPQIGESWLTSPTVTRPAYEESVLPAGAANAVPLPSVWVRSPAWDGFWMLSALWLAPIILWLCHGYSDPEDSPLDLLYFGLTALFWIGHRLSSTYLAYCTEAYRPLLRSQPVRFVVLPLLVTTGCFAVFLPSDTALPWSREERLVAVAILDYVFVTYHFAAQHFGALSLYRTRVGRNTCTYTRNMDRLFALGVGGVLVFLADILAGAVAYQDQWVDRWVFPAWLVSAQEGIRAGATITLLAATAAMLFVELRSMLDTPQRYPRAGSQNYPSPAAEPNVDGSTTVYFSPKQPTGIKRGNWIQTMPNKGWFTILRLYSPLEPFFDKSWRPSEIELVR